MSRESTTFAGLSEEEWVNVDGHLVILARDVMGQWKATQAIKHEGGKYEYRPLYRGLVGNREYALTKARGKLTEAEYFARRLERQREDLKPKKRTA